MLQRSTRVKASALLVFGVSSIFVVSGALAVLMRVVGTMAGIPFLAETVPVKVFTAIAAAPVLALAVIRRGYRPAFLVYAFGYLGILIIVFMHLVFSAPAESDAWNTVPFEFLRFFALYALPATVFLFTGDMPKVSSRACVLLLQLLAASGFFLILVAVLQTFYVVPHFYYQWFGHLKLGRPTGGLDHPHFYSMLLVLSMSAIYSLHNLQRFSQTTKYALLGLVLLGVILSTSRIGVLVCGFFLGYMEFFSSIRRVNVFPVKVFFFFFFVLCGIVLVALSWEWLISTRISVFVEAFIRPFIESFGGEEGAPFLRGRDERWQIEWGFITDSLTTLWFGYGHQPFVSHNLILRQLQVSGIFGTLCYLAMLLSLFLHVYRNTDGRYKDLIVALAVAFSIASVTFPIGISVPLLSGLACIAIAAINLSGHRLSG